MHERFLVHSRRGAYVALVVLTLIWGINWIVMKFALRARDPVVLNVQRTWLAVVVAVRRPAVAAPPAAGRRRGSPCS